MNFKENIPKIEKKIGYVFRDKSLLCQAFTRTSYSNEHSGAEKLQSNEVLEFFGDSVLSCAIVSFLVKECSDRYRYGIRTELGEGDFSNIKSKLSDKKNLSRATGALGLHQYLLVGEGDEKLGIREEPSVMEDLFESIIGAIYIDSDMDMNAVMRSVSGMLNVLEYLNSAPPMQSAKNALQEWCAQGSVKLGPPEYKTLSESGPDHKKLFERGVYIGGELMGTGKGKNLKIADSLAAEAALMRLKKERGAKKPTQKTGAEESKINTTEQKKASSPSAQPKKRAAVAPIKNNAAAGARESKRSPNGQKPNEKSYEGASARLRAYLISGGKPSATYRDLGSDGGSFSIECRVGDLAFVGKGESRLAARDTAAGKLLESIRAKKRKK